MDAIASILVAGATRTLDYGKALLEGIPDAQFARFATAGGATIEANHPAFVYGHLSLYPSWVLKTAGLVNAGVEPDEAYNELFKNGAVCRDDADGSLYPSREAIVDLYLRGHELAIEGVRGLSDEQLSAKHSLEGRMAELFPTVGHIANFMLNAHAMMHLGQISTWRRVIGLGSAM